MSTWANAGLSNAALTGAMLALGRIAPPGGQPPERRRTDPSRAAGWAEDMAETGRLPRYPGGYPPVEASAAGRDGQPVHPTDGFLAGSVTALANAAPADWASPGTAIGVWGQPPALSPVPVMPAPPLPEELPEPESYGPAPGPYEPSRRSDLSGSGLSPASDLSGSGHSPGAVDPLGTGSLDRASLEPALLEPTELEPTELEPTELEPTELEPTRPTALELGEVEPAVLGPTSLEPDLMEPTRLEPTLLGSSPLEPTGAGPTSTERARLEAADREPSAPDAATAEPEQVTPEQLTPEQLTPEQLTAEPVTPEQLTAEPVTPEQVTAEPDPMLEEGPALGSLDSSSLFEALSRRPG